MTKLKIKRLIDEEGRELLWLNKDNNDISLYSDEIEKLRNELKCKGGDSGQ
jgi:hypothetical protein